MANLTLSIDDELLKRARIKALEEGTSVNALVRDHLERFAGGKEREREAVRQILEDSKTSTASSRGRGRTWTRDDLYEERPRYLRDRSPRS